MSGSLNSKRPLDGLVIGISVSESENLAEWGYTSADVNRATVRLSEALLAAGAGLMFGHDWRPDGVMDAVCRLAVKFQPAETRGPNKPLVHNLLPWPYQPSMDPSLRTELEQRGVLKIETLPAPRGDWQSPTDDTAKALALTEMRQRLANDCDARVCLGGREARLPTDKIGGFYAGVIEEAYFTVKADKPVYFASCFGGACGSLVTYLKGQASDKAEAQQVFRVVPSKKAHFEACKSRAVSSTVGTAAVSGPRPIDALPEDLRTGFVAKKLQERSGLNAADWNELLDAPDTEAFVTRVIRGLREVALRKSAPQPQSNPSPAPVSGRGKRTRPRK